MSKSATIFQTLVGAGVLLIALGLAWGAVDISSASGYGGVGPNFLPWFMAAALLGCGVFIVWESLSGGFRSMELPAGQDRPYWPGFIWITAGMLINAALINRIGFILSCTLCFVLAVRGLRGATEMRDKSLASWLKDAAIGAAISAPVFWMFTKFLAISLPGLTSSGWI
jgi:putative tricarboxylic transport membrane protein